jgi:hypothetical protein
MGLESTARRRWQALSQDVLREAEQRSAVMPAAAEATAIVGLLRHIDDSRLRKFLQSLLTHLRAEAGLFGAAKRDVRW